MSLLLLFGGGTTNPAGPVVNIALGAPVGGSVFTAGAANIALGSPVGTLVTTFVAGSVVNITFGAPPGSPGGVAAAVANIALGAPVGGLVVQFFAGPVANIALGAPVGQPAVYLADPLQVWLLPSALVALVEPNRTGAILTPPSSQGAF